MDVTTLSFSFSSGTIAIVLGNSSVVSDLTIDTTSSSAGSPAIGCGGYAGSSQIAVNPALYE